MSWLVLAGDAGATVLPSGFHEETAFSPLTEPTAIRFSPDGRVFVAQKSGRIVVYDNVEDTTPVEFADLSEKVYAAGDRGLLGLALDPDFPTRPYVYALYTYDHELGEPGEGPRWEDHCPNPPGPEIDGCVVSGRLVRLEAQADHMIGNEKVLVEGWCQQFPSHSVGTLQFGSDGSLYASGGEGANYNAADYGQFGYPEANPCGDPPGGVGGVQAPPDAEGGSLRAQDARTLSDPTGLSGSVIRVDPATGEGLPGNPMYGSSDPNARRIVAYGFRNPFRFTLDSVSNELYVNNVGQEAFEEIDRFNAIPASAYNSGWPCYEGDEVNPPFASLGLKICEELYEDPAATSKPFFKYDHYAPVVPGEGCSFTNGSALTGSDFYDGDQFPAAYRGALFFADSVRGCIYAMAVGENGRPDPSTVSNFVSDAGLYPGIDIQTGPEGDLYYVSLFGPEFGPGAVHRITYTSENTPPVAVLQADEEWSEEVPVEVEFDASESHDSGDGGLIYEWDLNGDGVFEGPDEPKNYAVFDEAKNYSVAVRVTDEDGASSTDRITIYAGDTPPQVEIYEPKTTLRWSAGEEIYFEGGAEDIEDGSLPPTDLDWTARLYHCPSACHAHPLEAYPGVAFGNLIAPAHEYPSYLELRLTAADERGLSASRVVRIDPETVDLTFLANPPGLSLGAGFEAKPTPFTQTFIKGVDVQLTAPPTETLNGHAYEWASWSDGGERVHSVKADEAATYTASYSTFPELIEPTPVPPMRPSLITHPGKKTKKRSAVFAFATDLADASFRCRLDDRGFKPCSSPKKFKHLAPGHHSFGVIATNAGGSLSSAPAKFTWLIRRSRR